MKDILGVRIRKLDMEVVKRGGREGSCRARHPPSLHHHSVPAHLRHHPSATRTSDPHSSNPVATQSRPLAAATAFDLGNWNCVECGTTLSPWLCLFCGLIHCGRYVNQDGLRHFNHSPMHSLCMDCQSFAVFCYSCDDFVNTDTIDKRIRNIRESLQFFNNVRLSDHTYYFPRFLPGMTARPNNRTEKRTQKRPLVHSELPGTSSSVCGHPPPGKEAKKPVIRNIVAIQEKRIKEENGEEEQKVVVPTRKPTVVKAINGKRVNGKKPGLRGLRNLGNSCFMNAVLQSLNNITEFSKTLVTMPETLVAKNTNGFSSPAHRTRRSGPEQVFLTEELRKTLLALQETEKNSAISPDALFSVIWKLVPRFRGFQQQDAHEFLRCVLDRLMVELKNEDDGRGGGWEGANGGSDAPLVSALFQGVLQSEVTCLSCAGSSRKQDPFLDLSLDIPTPESPDKNGPRLTLIQCLQSFFDKEELDHSEQYMCSSCRRKRPSTKQFFVRRAPNVLCLHLKRFKWHQGRQKIDHFVEFPLRDMDLSQFALTSNGHGNTEDGAQNGTSNSDFQRVTRGLHNSRHCVFNLAALVVHHGSSAGSGHYTAYVHRDKSWYHVNDSAVRTSSETTVVQQKAYILFYVRQKPDGSSEGPES